MNKNFKTILRLWDLLKPFHKYFYLQLGLTVTAQLINIYAVYQAAQIINSIVAKNFQQAGLYLLSIFLFNQTRYLLQFISDKMSIRHLENGVSKFLEEFSLKNVFNLNASQYIEDHSAIKLQVITRGEEAVKSIISMLVLTLLPTGSQVIFSILAITYFSPLVGLVCAATFVIATIWAKLFSDYHSPIIKKNLENLDNVRKIRSETYQHLSLIKISGVEKDYLKKYIHKRGSIVEYDVFTWTKNNLNNKLRFSFFNFSKTLNTGIIIYLIYQGKLLIGDLYALLNWMNDAFNNIANVVQVTRQLPLRFVELEKYLDIIDKVPVFKETGNKKIPNGDIVVSNLNFKYPHAESQVIENLNLTIPQGKKVAFVGFSGSGKSTIIKLLLRMYDWDKGDITLAGKSLRDIDAQTLRQRIGYVEQHVDLFDTTIRENIFFGIPSGHKTLTDKQLDEIVHKARIDQFFHRLGDTGLDTVIGERGVKLSGGERQRIGIARALAKNPEILIFDEATASLDTENEKYIQEAIDESSKGRTTIIIAHRLSTVQNADMIVVMDKGRIVNYGTHYELEKASPEYQRLIHAQNN